MSNPDGLGKARGSCDEAAGMLASGKSISQALAITPDVIFRELESIAQL